MNAPATPHRLVLPLVAVLALAACGQATPRTPTLADAQRVGVRNARSPLPGLVTAGQPTREQMDSLVAAGFDRFVSLRLPDEEGAGWEEAYATQAGVSFTRLPVTGADGLTREAVEALDRILTEAEGDDIVLYCGSSNRVGALMALRAFWLGGASADESLALGRAAGMTRLEGAVADILANDESP